MSRFFYIFFIIFFHLFSLSFSQDDSEFFMEKLIIRKQYDPNIEKNIKRHNHPTYVDSIKIDKKEVKYFSQEILDYSFFEKIDVQNSPKMSRLYNSIPNNNLLLGLGSQDMFELDFTFNELFEFQKEWGFSFDHYSKNFFLLNNLVKNEDGVDNYKYLSLDGFSNNSISLFGKKEISNSQLNFNLDFMHQNGLYYGGATEDDLDSLSAYNNIGFDLSLKLSKINKKGLLNNLDVNYSYFTKQHIRFQSYFELKSTLSYNIWSADINLDLNFNINNNKLLLIPDFTNYSQFQQQYSSTYFEHFNSQTFYSSSFKPYLQVWGQNLGFSYNWTGLRDSNKLHFFPYLYLVNKKYNLAFKYHGYLKPYFFSDLLMDIPYLTPFFKDTFSKKNIYQISFSKKINSKLSSVITASYLYEKGHLVPFLLHNNSSIGSPIGMYFDNLRKLKLNLNLSYNHADIETFFNLSINSMNSDYYNDIKYIPMFSFEYFFQVKPVDKLLLSFNINYSSKREVLDFQAPAFHYADSEFFDNNLTSTRELSNFLILNFDIKYRLNDQFKFNVGVKNLMDSQYELFDSYYPERMRRFFINLTYSF